MFKRAVAALVLVIGASLVVSAPVVRAQDEAEPEFTEAFLNDQANIELGKELFQRQCTSCHGRSAYPGKAPKLKPAKMPPDDIYTKVTYGFRKMPPWEHVFSNHERAAITAYMKSDIFSN